MKPTHKQKETQTKRQKEKQIINRNRYLNRKINGHIQTEREIQKLKQKKTYTKQKRHRHKYTN